MDIAIATSDEVVFRLGDGAGGFKGPNPPNLDLKSSAIVTGDFNLDGISDLAIVHPDVNKVFVALGNGDGTFGDGTLASIPAFQVGQAPSALVAADFK